MRAVLVFVLLHYLLLSVLPASAAEEGESASSRGERGRRSPPYWGMWSSDFIGWLEELRAQGDHQGVQNLAHTFWAHFPIATQLGYDSPESDLEE
ncbi:hypothetical protein CgunFtcFv8_024420 [Champsocephalus gunnari]|uniref:Otospiralin n=1 Tax=Champsocephalus gunnari TaxID=52237 RepID=A0AAN8DGI8_CHAGU|nr:hypothetical protein CgunFtcFv8_024420 [Champsocephalus gunnari]